MPEGFTVPRAFARDRSFVASQLPEEIRKGAYELAKISFRDVEFRDRSVAWQSPYWDDRRALALEFWMGSEQDVALLRLDGEGSSGSQLRIYHVFDTQTSQSMQRLIGATWNDERSYHQLSCKDIDLEKVVALLLTYYNGVFFDDCVQQRSRVYLQLPMPNPPGEELAVSSIYGDQLIYKRSDYWTPFHDLFYQGVRRPDGAQI